MKTNRFSLFFHHFRDGFQAMLLVMATTVPLFLIGRNVLGEGVIALIYLLPITWSAFRWGRPAGISAALSAALMFDFLFIPPFFTFTVGRLEGWLLLAIFLAVAIIVVEWIQATLSKAREAVFMYEMAVALTNQRTPEGVANTVAHQIRQLFQATLVNVLFHPDKEAPSIAASDPEVTTIGGKPDRIIPILNAWDLIGEIQIWQGVFIDLPPVESKLLQNFAQQTGRAFARTQPGVPEKPINDSINASSNKQA